jgi:hypothetical protein
MTSITADGQTALGRIGAIKRAGGGISTLIASGGFGGGTLSVEVSFDGTTYVPLSPAVALTAAGAISWEARAPFHQLDMTGSTTPTVEANVV